MTTAENLSEKRPVDAARLDISPNDPAKSTMEAMLPFRFRFYGRNIDRVAISARGWVLPGTTSTSRRAADGESAIDREQSANGRFPFAATSPADGVIAPLWTRLEYRTRAASDTGATGDPGIYTWTVGVAPKRHFVVAWENASVAAVTGDKADMTKCQAGDVIVKVDPRYFRPTEVETLLGDASKARIKLGWTPKITLAELVAEMVQADYTAAKRDSLVKGAGFQAYDHHE